MKKFIPVVAVLAMAFLAVTGCGIPQKDYDAVVAERDTAQSQVTSLRGELTAAQGQVQTLQGQIQSVQGGDSKLKSDFLAATSKVQSLEGDVSTLKDLNSTLSQEQKKIKYPRHFANQAELTAWLQKDDTNTKYGAVSALQRAFVLQARAIQDGYLLQVRMPDLGRTDFVMNVAIIGDTIYYITSSDDSVEKQGVLQVVPAYPIPPE